MSAHTVHRLIGRALTDRQFRENLLESPQHAIREYTLTQRERALISSLRAMTLEDFSQQLSAGLEDASEGEHGS